MSMIEDSVEKATQWMVFQPNDDDLRRMVTHSLNVFLQAIWLTGGLQGASPADGLFRHLRRHQQPAELPLMRGSWFAR